jgi:hypothetical protein
MPVLATLTTKVTEVIRMPTCITLTSDSHRYGELCREQFHHTLHPDGSACRHTPRRRTPYQHCLCTKCERLEHVIAAANAEEYERHYNRAASPPRGRHPGWFGI